MRRVGIVICTTLCSITADPSRAAEWSVQPSVDLRGEYNDNINFTPAPHPSVWGVILSPEAKFSGTTETLNVTGGLRFNFNRYFGEQGLDTNDYVLSVRSDYKSERDVLGLNIDWIHDSTLASELAQTGVVVTRQQRTFLLAAPTWSRALSETTALTAGYTYSEARYADAAATGAVNYTDQSATLGLQFRLGERDVASVSAYYSRYDTAQSIANTYGAQVAYDRAFSETLRGSFVVGTRHTENTVFSQAVVCDGPIIFGTCAGNLVTLSSNVTDRSNGFIFSALVEKKWETGAISGELGQEVNPSGIGQLVQTDRVRMAWTEQWSPTVTSSVSAAVYATGDISNLVSSSDSRYFTIEPRVDWKITEDSTLSAGYSYSRVKYQDNPASATQNVAYVILNYTWPKISVSR